MDHVLSEMQYRILDSHTISLTRSGKSVTLSAPGIAKSLFQIAHINISTKTEVSPSLAQQHKILIIATAQKLIKDDEVSPPPFKKENNELLKLCLADFLDYRLPPSLDKNKKLRMIIAAGDSVIVSNEFTQEEHCEVCFKFLTAKWINLFAKNIDTELLFRQGTLLIENARLSKDEYVFFSYSGAFERGKFKPLIGCPKCFAP